MERRRLGQLEVSAIGLGCATMTPFYGEPDPASAIATIRRAATLGIDFLDTSDAYGNGRNEELITQAVDGRRHEYVIASKFGNLRHRNGTPTADGRPEYVTAACERSLQRLRTEFIDLYYIHRVDPTVPIEDTVGAMSGAGRRGAVPRLVQQGPRDLTRIVIAGLDPAIQLAFPAARELARMPGSIQSSPGNADRRRYRVRAHSPFRRWGPNSRFFPSKPGISSIFPG